MIWLAAYLYLAGLFAMFVAIRALYGADRIPLVMYACVVLWPVIVPVAAVVANLDHAPVKGRAQ